MSSSLTPAQIVAALDAFIIGQAAAKRAVAIALRNRWRRLQASLDLRAEIVPANILMIGATGVGKTEIARRLAALAGAPFVKVEASKFTEVGYVGRDVESMVRDLAEAAVHLVREKRKEEVRLRAAELAEEAILDLLLPPLRLPGEPGFKKDQPTPTADDRDLNERTRTKLREKLRAGELDTRNVEIEITVPAQQVQLMGPMGMEGGGMDGLQDMLQNMMPKRKKKRTLTIAEAREVLTEEEAQKLIDPDAVNREALELAQQSGIIFIDEIDKVARRGGAGGQGPDVSREGVQRDLLPVVEGTTVTTKYGPLKTDHVLFIAAGAFHVARPADLIPELQGRFPIRVELQPLTEEDFYQILRSPRTALTRQYEALLAAEGVSLTFTDEALRSLAALAYRVNQEVENIGARRLHTLMSALLEEVLYNVPDQTPERTFTVTPDWVTTRLAGLVSSKQLSEFIL